MRGNYYCPTADIQHHCSAKLPPMVTLQLLTVCSTVAHEREKNYWLLNSLQGSKLGKKLGHISCLEMMFE